MRFNPLFIVLFIAFLVNTANARDYAIEVIIFVNEDGVRQNAEIFDPEKILVAPSEGISFFGQDIDQIEIETEENPWRLLPQEDYILNEQVRKLDNSRQYRVLKHFAWRQPVVDRDSAKPILIKTGFDFSGLYPERTFQQIEFSDTEPYPEDESIDGVWELEGTLNVVITRYLHIYSDLVYRMERSNPLYTNDALQPEQVLVDYEVNSHRRMRSGELHYIDHPIVGILVEATPIEEEEENLSESN
ncbi:MAG: CsiV family protein [Pseudomonadota bacterium]